MADNNGSNGVLGVVLGVVLGGVLAAAAALFILTGGELGGKKKVEGDADIPPIALQGNGN